MKMMKAALWIFSWVKEEREREREGKLWVVGIDSICAGDAVSSQGFRPEYSYYVCILCT